MKKFGFTLAEVLITLSILGIVASMTVPMLVNSHKSQLWGNSLATAISNFQKAMNNMMYEEGTDNILYTKAWMATYSNQNLMYNMNRNSNAPVQQGDADGTIINNFMYNLSKHLKVTDFDTNTITYSNIPNNLPNSDINQNLQVRFKTKNGIEYQIVIRDIDRSNAILANNINTAGTYYKKVGELYIDVTGENGPNSLGKDLFIFDIDSEGKLHAYRDRDWCLVYNVAEIPVADLCKGENNQAQNLAACGAYLMQNEYNIDY